ncbi:LytR/AlgR family response regulator transcription factor [Gracilimonas sp.]|uniref:LytR/AlgR family response regulator transcription factor n=1 Tax=Gracilimonas sp. TaxID=1974203 RepID=UPI003D101139
MNILIIEDEMVAAERLENSLLQIDPNFKIVEKISSVKESVQWLMKNQADLIFLDIQLSDGISFSIFEQIRITTPVIFTTAYDQYAIKAFELNSIGYLLKPIRRNELEESLEKLESLKSVFTIDIESLITSYRNPKNTYKNRFLVFMGEKLKKIETEEIAYFYAMQKNVFARTFDNKTYPMDFSLDALEEELDPSKYFRINRQYLVNIEAIEQMIALSRSRIKLLVNPAPGNNADTIVSISRSREFKNWLDN